MTRLLYGVVALVSTAAFASGFTLHRERTREGRDDAWVVMQEEGSATMSGSSLDLRRARRQLARSHGAILWFRHGGREYVVENEAAIGRILAAAKPQEELSQRQSALGEQQAELGRRQAELGHAQAALAMRQVQRARKAALAADDDDRIDRPGREVLERDFEARQRAIEREQEDLGRDQEELGREQERLGKQQEKLARDLERTVGQVIDESLRTGTAHEIDD
jgi:hypothetical protein